MNVQEKIITLRNLLSNSPKNPKEIIREFISSDPNLSHELIIDILNEVFTTVNDSYIDSVIEHFIEKFNKVRNNFAFCV